MYHVIHEQTSLMVIYYNKASYCANVWVLLHESMLDTLDRLVTQELERVQKGDITRATQQKDQA